MRSTWQDLPVLLRHPQLWRERLLPALMNRSWWLTSRLATSYRRTIVGGTRVAAVVGSLGKTTTTRAVSAALGYDLPTWYQHSFKNAYNAVGLRILDIRPSDPYSVVEVGIREPGVMAPIAQMLRPDVVVVTSIMSEHQQYFGTLKVTRAEKSEMVRVLPASGTAVLNGDDPNVRWMAGQTQSQVLTYGFDADNDVRAEDIKLEWPKGMRFKLRVPGETRDVTIRLLGKHMVYPILAAVAVALVEGLNLDQVMPALGSLPPTLARLQPIHLGDGTIILRDDAKAGFESTDVALDLLSEVPTERRGVVISWLYDLPADPDQVYHALGQRIARIASFAVFVGDDPGMQGYVKGAESGGLAPEQIVHLSDRPSDTFKAVRDQMEPGDIILVKGVSSRRLGQVSLALEGRPVRCYRLDCRWGIFCDHCPMLERGWD